MCVSPIKIPNPNKGYHMPLKDCESQYIYVPCGQCSECIYIRQTSVVQRVQMESYVSHLFFITLTYNNEFLPEVTTSEGFSYNYVDWSDFQKMFKRIRAGNYFDRDFKYFAVSERGSKNHRPHIHLIFALRKLPSDDAYTPHTLFMQLFPVFLNEWQKNLGSKRKPIYKPLCTYKEKFVRGHLFRNYDVQLMKKENDSSKDVAYYVTKYMLKPSKFEKHLNAELFTEHSTEEALAIWKLIRSKSVKSLNFGWSDDPADKILPYLKECVKRSIINDCDCVQFYNPFDGTSMPLSRFYKSKGLVYSPEDNLFFFKKLHPDGNPIFVPDDLRNASVINGSTRLDRLIEVSDTADIFDISDF